MFTAVRPDSVDRHPADLRRESGCGQEPLLPQQEPGPPPTGSAASLTGRTCRCAGPRARRSGSTLPALRLSGPQESS